MELELNRKQKIRIIDELIDSRIGDDLNLIFRRIEKYYDGTGDRHDMIGIINHYFSHLFDSNNEEFLTIVFKDEEFEISCADFLDAIKDKDIHYSIDGDDITFTSLNFKKLIGNKAIYGAYLKTQAALDIRGNVINGSIYHGCFSGNDSRVIKIWENDGTTSKG